MKRQLPRFMLGFKMGWWLPSFCSKVGLPRCSISALKWTHICFVSIFSSLVSGRYFGAIRGNPLVVDTPWNTNTHIVDMMFPWISPDITSRKVFTPRCLQRAYCFPSLRQLLQIDHDWGIERPPEVFHTGGKDQHQRGSPTSQDGGTPFFPQGPSPAISRK